MATAYNFKKKITIFDWFTFVRLNIYCCWAFYTCQSLVYESDATVTKSLLVGISFLLFGLVTITSYSGVFLDFKKNTFQRYYSFAGFRSGQWEALPLFKLVKVFPHISKGSPISNGVNSTPTLTVTQYVVALYGDQVKPVIVLEYNNKNLALEGAKCISQGLKLELNLNL